MRLTAADLEHAVVPIDSLRPFPGNARIHDDELLDESIGEHGVFQAIVVSSDGFIVSGNGTWARAKEAGEQSIAITRLPLRHDDPQATKINLVANRANDRAGYDNGLLAVQLTAMVDLAGTGWGEDERADIVATAKGPVQGLTDPDAVPDPPAKPITKLGDLWLLGEHRLLCGDSRNEAEVERVAAGGVQLLWTDPPYGVGYVGKTAAQLTLRNDDAEGLPALLAAAFAAASRMLEPGAPFYIAHPAGALSLTFLLAVRDAGWQIHQTLVWVKDTMVLGHADYHYQHEPILYGWLPGQGRSGRGKHAGTRWYGDNAAVSVFTVDRPKRSEEHPTAKPVDLIRPHVRNSSRAGEAILDLFAGSGSTLIAAHQERRVARLVEIDPSYVDVTCRRFQEFTGILPVLEATGEEHDFVAAVAAHTAA